jgi:hypothetical protein
VNIEQQKGEERRGDNEIKRDRGQRESFEVMRIRFAFFEAAPDRNCISTHSRERALAARVISEIRRLFHHDDYGFDKKLQILKSDEFCLAILHITSYHQYKPILQISFQSFYQEPQTRSDPLWWHPPKCDYRV